MAFFNQATVVGNLGNDPKTSMTKQGRKMASFSVATTERGYTTRENVTIPDRTDWHNIVLWGNLAEIAAKFLHKGSMVLIQGKMHTRQYEAKDGSTRYITEIEGDTMQMLDRKPTDNVNPQSPMMKTATGFEPNPSYNPQPSSTTASPKKDDDLPF